MLRIEYTYITYVWGDNTSTGTTYIRYIHTSDADDRPLQTGPELERARLSKNSECQASLQT